MFYAKRHIEKCLLLRPTGERGKQPLTNFVSCFESAWEGYWDSAWRNTTTHAADDKNPTAEEADS